MSGSRKPRTTKTTYYPRGWRRYSLFFGGPRYRYVHSDANGNRTISHGGPISKALGCIIGIPLAIAAPFIIVWALISGVFHIVLDPNVNALQHQAVQPNSPWAALIATGIDQALYPSISCNDTGVCSSGPDPYVTVTSIDSVTCSSGWTGLDAPGPTNGYSCFVQVSVAGPSGSDAATTLGGSPATGTWTANVLASCSDSQGHGCGPSGTVKDVSRVGP
jgi:hypothetical protein